MKSGQQMNGRRTENISYLVKLVCCVVLFHILYNNDTVKNVPHQLGTGNTTSKYMNTSL